MEVTTSAHPAGPVGGPTRPAARSARTRCTDAPISRRGQVVALHHLPAISLGGLTGRTPVGGERLVPAMDAGGTTCWIDALAVWSDGETIAPENVRPVGLAAASSWTNALLGGLSDRLGWEAAQAWGRGVDLPPATALEHRASPRMVVLDGRLDHEVPTVVTVSHTGVRWGAGASWESALGRAMYGADPSAAADELPAMADALSRHRIGVVGVDVGTSFLSVNHLSRLSVQLTCFDAAVRGWYAPAGSSSSGGGR